MNRSHQLFFAIKGELHRQTDSEFSSFYKRIKKKALTDRDGQKSLLKKPIRNILREY